MQTPCTIPSWTNMGNCIGVRLVRSMVCWHWSLSPHWRIGLRLFQVHRLFIFPSMSIIMYIFTDGESLKPVKSTSPTPKLMFSDFLPPSVMTSTTLSLDHHVPVPLPSAYLTGVVHTALPKMQGVMQSLHRTIMSAYAKGSTNHVSHPPPPHESGMGSTSSETSSVDASVDKLKSSASEPKA